MMLKSIIKIVFHIFLLEYVKKLHLIFFITHFLQVTIYQHDNLFLLFHITIVQEAKVVDRKILP